MGQAAADLSVKQGRANMPLLEDVQKPEALKAFEAESNDFDRPKHAWRNQLAEHWGADVELTRAANDGSNVDTVTLTVLSVSTCRPGGYLCTTLPNYFPANDGSNCWFVGFRLLQVPSVTFRWSAGHGGCLRDRRSHPEGGCA